MRFGELGSMGLVSKHLCEVVPVGERPSLTYMPGPSPSQIGPGITYNRLVVQ
jgi:hypothetical protein